MQREKAILFDFKAMQHRIKVAPPQQEMFIL